MRSILATAVLCLSSSISCRAQEAPRAPDPTRAALVQMLGEAQGREAAALVQVHTLRAQVLTLQTQADEAARKPVEPEQVPSAK